MPESLTAQVEEGILRSALVVTRSCDLEILLEELQDFRVGKDLVFDEPAVLRQGDDREKHRCFVRPGAATLSVDSKAAESLDVVLKRIGMYHTGSVFVMSVVTQLC